MTGYEVLAAPQVDSSRGYTEAQYVATAELAKMDMQKYGFGIDMIVGHDEIRKNYNDVQTGPGKKRAVKTDPGRTWDWDKFRDLILA